MLRRSLLWVVTRRTLSRPAIPEAIPNKASGHHVFSQTVTSTRSSLVRLHHLMSSTLRVYNATAAPLSSPRPSTTRD
jgi:hypothetical protein